MGKKKSCKTPIIFTVISLVITVLGIILVSVGINQMENQIENDNPWDSVGWWDYDNLNGMAIAGSSLLSFGFLMLFFSLIFLGICYYQ